MTTQKTKTEQRQQFLSMWQKESKNGKKYFTGKDASGNQLVGFYNTKKKNPKEPDIKIYLSNDEAKLEKPFISMWCNISKTGKKYLAGVIDDKKYIGFFNELKEGSNRPYFSVYVLNDTKQENNDAKAQRAKTIIIEEVHDLPF